MTKPTKTLIDLSYLQEVASDNTAFIIEMIDIFLEQTPDYVAILKQAVDEKNWSKIAEMAHKIKPTLAFMGANEGQITMASIEDRARLQEDYDGIKSDLDVLSSDFKQMFVGWIEKKN